MPTDARLKDGVSRRYESVSLDMDQSARNRSNGVKIMIVDACRDNPLRKKLIRTPGLSRSGALTRGLTGVDRSQGTVTAFATQSNQVAQDGTGRNRKNNCANKDWLKSCAEISNRCISNQCNRPTPQMQGYNRCRNWPACLNQPSLMVCKLPVALESFIVS